MDFAAWFLIVSGILFMLVEMVIPGGVLAPLGLGLFVVELVRYFGIVTSHTSLIMLWLLSSLSMIIIARIILSKVTPGETETCNLEDKFDSYGTIVKVLETIKPGEHGGRIRHEGSSWKAISVSNVIKEGEKAKLIGHDSETGAWIVEALTDFEIDNLDDE